MSQHRAKNPLEALQGMVNGVLIETGKALRAADKESGRNLATAYPRLRTSIPAVIENFHQVLDEFEMEIVRAKAVLLRDLGEQRSRRKALETPVPVIEEEPLKEEPEMEMERSYDTKEESQAATEPVVKQEQSQLPGGANTPQNGAINSHPAIQESVKTEDFKEPLRSITEPKPSPTSANENQNSPNAVGLGINNAQTGDDAPVAPDMSDAAIDSLFDIQQGGSTDGDGALNFADLDFTMDDTAPDNQDTQGGNNDFDLSTFGNSAQDFAMPDQDANINTTAANALDNPPATSQPDDPFGMNTTSGGDDMDLDLDLDMTGESSMFDDMFAASGDYDTLGGGDDMKHGEFDAEFFGLSKDGY